MSTPTPTPLASPPTSTPWVPMWPVNPALNPGAELAYAETAADVTVPVVAQAAAATILTAPAITVDGATDVVIQAYLAYVLSSGVATAIFNLWDGSTDLGNIGQTTNPAATNVGYPMYLMRRLRPSAGTHTFSIRGWAQSGTWTAVGSAGGAQRQPMFIRITQVGTRPGELAPGVVPYGTSLPGSPRDGQEAILVDSLTNPTYQWRFRYNAGSALTDKWEFIGGAPALAAKSASDSLALTSTKTAIPNSPSITVPRAGRYIVRHGLTQQIATSTAYINSFDAGGSSIVPISTGGAAISGVTTLAHPSGSDQIDLSAGAVLVQRVSSGQAQTWTFAVRYIELTPIRVS